MRLRGRLAVVLILERFELWPENPFNASARRNNAPEIANGISASQIHACSVGANAASSAIAPRLNSKSASAFASWPSKNSEPCLSIFAVAWSMSMDRKAPWSSRSTEKIVSHGSPDLCA